MGSDPEFCFYRQSVKKMPSGFDLFRNRVDLQWPVIVLIEIADNRKTVPNIPLIAKINDYIYSLK